MRLFKFVLLAMPVSKIQSSRGWQKDYLLKNVYSSFVTSEHQSFWSLILVIQIDQGSGYAMSARFPHDIQANSSSYLPASLLVELI
jgi:hypothetical protein